MPNAARSMSAMVSSRELEMKWLEDNKELLATLSGKWIALEGGTLVGADVEFAKVSDKARSSGIVSPFILYVPESVPGSSIGL
ncbi:MAG: hypothetical protein KF749_08765 [Bacteroidetes bacterium]|nr:hypothetical protein [Bacteroidota bacterium]MCW5895902.1 hypothetical protein [Bacteroidota bacterium]